MIDLKSAYCDHDVSFEEKFSHGLVGVDIDERTSKSISHVGENSNFTVSLEYDPESLSLKIDGSSVECHDFYDYLSGLGIQSLLIDATSLEVPELALVLKAVLSMPSYQVLLVYFEPDQYSSTDNGTLDMEEFGLSDQILGFEGAGIPTVSMPVDDECDRKFVFFVGFEAGRLQSAIETYDISSDEAKIFFGIPAFRPGWEAKSIRRNLQALSEQSFKGRVGYCSAGNSSDALNSLRKVGFHEEGQGFMYVVPIGTKPNSIAAIIFSVENSDKVRLLYDQPTKSAGRSTGVGRRHYYYMEMK